VVDEPSKEPSLVSPASYRDQRLSRSENLPRFEYSTTLNRGDGGHYNGEPSAFTLLRFDSSTYAVAMRIVDVINKTTPFFEKHDVRPAVR
jgi:hypothetical protein